MGCIRSVLQLPDRMDNFMLSRPDQEAMLACVREHLTDNGQFLVDVCGRCPSQMVNQLEEIAWFTLTHRTGRQIYVSGTDQYDFTQQFHIQTCYERWDERQGELVRPPWGLTLRYIMTQDMESLLHYNGFKVVASYADYDGTPGTAEAPATLWICEQR